jgi:hypothetical protein
LATGTSTKVEDILRNGHHQDGKSLNHSVCHSNFFGDVVGDPVRVPPFLWIDKLAAHNESEVQMVAPGKT